MNNQTFVIASILLCSLGGWYVVLTKYLALKQMVKDHNNAPPHIPGMGPPPVTNLPFNLPEDVGFMGHENVSHASMQHDGGSYADSGISKVNDKRIVCNWACILHVSGFAIISGIPFLNIIAPVILWLWKKEEHPFLAKQGREVINFQITYTLIQFLCLGGGILFIRFMPSMAEKLFAATKIARIVFSTSMYLPFNIFTVLPFFWCCIVMIRGAVAAYHGLSYKYPGAQPFIANPSDAPKTEQSPAYTPPVEPPEVVPPPHMTGKVNFG